MATETELKLSLSLESVQMLLRHPLLTATPTQQHLYNTYFDTDDLALTRQKVAVRERRVNDQTLLTVKTAGQSAGGLSQRHEWEAPTEPGAFDFQSLMDDPALADSLTALTNELVPVFTTDFERLTWRIAIGHSDIEVALDRGAIRVDRHGQQASTPICEVELELKSGDIAALNTLSQRLRALVPLIPTDESKAARGYALFHSLAA
jgi:inorganic triphosphatase YgiF